MSNLIVSMKAEALLARLAGTYERLRADLRVVVTRLGIKAQGVVKEGKLTGQVLHVRSGTLRRSINLKVDETDTGVVATVGTNVKYARAHEEGFDGIQHVKAYTRRSVLQMSVKRTARARVSEGTINVRAHDRHMVLFKRSFLVSTLTEMSGEIKTSLRATILQAVRP